MRILFVADCAIPVPPKGYGGTERVLDYLINGVVERGHEITLMAAPGSCVPGRLIEFSDARSYPRVIRGIAKLVFWLKLVRQLADHDLVHSFGRLDYLVPALKCDVPKVITFQNPVHQSQLDFLCQRIRGPLVLTTCGNKMMEGLRMCGVWRPIHNAVPVDSYPFSPRPSEPYYLVFLGRLTPSKGAHVAISVAREAGIRLILAGNIGTAPGDEEYFRRDIYPEIDGDFIRYVGELDDIKKKQLLAGAFALLNPIQWDEPFGIVAIEALACGTPVITFARGDMRYIVRDGITGFICSNENEMVGATARISDVLRPSCRAHAKSHFDISIMVDKYCRVYDSLLKPKTAPEFTWKDTEWDKD